MKDNEKAENPSAFPDPRRGAESSFHNQSPWELSNGMPLRDYFAAKALPAVMRDYNGTEKDSYDVGLEESEMIAVYAYEIADAMLKARQQ